MLAVKESSVLSIIFEVALAGISFSGPTISPMSIMPLRHHFIMTARKNGPYKETFFKYPIFFNVLVVSLPVHLQSFSNKSYLNATNAPQIDALAPHMLPRLYSGKYVARFDGMQT